MTLKFITARFIKGLSKQQRHLPRPVTEPAAPATHATQLDQAGRELCPQAPYLPRCCRSGPRGPSLAAAGPRPGGSPGRRSGTGSRTRGARDASRKQRAGQGGKGKRKQRGCLSANQEEGGGENPLAGGCSQSARPAVAARGARRPPFCGRALAKGRARRRDGSGG